MPELRRDPITGRWVIVNIESPLYPSDFHIEPHKWKGEEGCPFCYGNENLTPPEIEAIRLDGGKPNTPGWKVRVVPNKYPALRIEGDLNKRGLRLYDMSNGIGAHEVIIDSPYHYKGLDELEDEEVQFLIKAYRSRSQDLVKDRRFKYILIFKNVGLSAGASLEHGHSQLIALPMVPKNVSEEIRGSTRYISYHERCIFCDIISQELTNDRERIITENEKFIALSPLSARFSFETWILPKEHRTQFMDIKDEEIPYLAKILKEVIFKIRRVLFSPPYNYIIHTSPVNSEEPLGYHWHIEIMPKLSRTAGFEWGSGFYVVGTPPEVAAKFLRGEM
ncbi:MAG: galactose-1-phosphate uridylyltransferase [Candidatus Omnitrophota bacterium]|nr:MAG: galactose-1-phosphate uridylyltransferase [Candidatus Omnitrophota bacterium]